MRAARVVVVVLLLLIVGLLVAADQWRRQREAAALTDLAPVGGRWVAAGDAELFVQEWGPANGPLLLLSHGTGAWSGTWFSLPDLLSAAGWHVVAADLPPFGFSRMRPARAEPDYTRAAQAKRLLALIDALGGRGVTLVGHSFGAGPALEAALLDSGRLRQLILVDPALGLGPAGEPPACTPKGFADALLSFRPVRLALIGDIVTQPRFTPFLLSQFVSRKDAVTPDRVSAYQRPFGLTGFSDGLGDWVRIFSRASCERALSLDPKALAAWSTQGLPVTLLWGEDDSVTPLAQAKALMQWMPQAELTVIPRVGHIPHIEDPEAFARVLLDATRP